MSCEIRAVVDEAGLGESGIAEEGFRDEDDDGVLLIVPEPV